MTDSKYDKDSDIYIYPNGQHLTYFTTSRVGNRDYKSDSQVMCEFSLIRLIYPIQKSLKGHNTLCLRIERLDKVGCQHQVKCYIDIKKSRLSKSSQLPVTGITQSE